MQVGSAYYVAGSYPPDDAADGVGAEVDYDDPANQPQSMKRAYGDFAGDRRADVLYLDKEDTHNVLHDQTLGGPLPLANTDAPPLPPPPLPQMNAHHPLYDLHRNDPGYNPFRPAPTPSPLL